MNVPRLSIAMPSTVHRDLSDHLLRVDGQEDICLATFASSTGSTRLSRLLTTVELPHDGERMVHGNATITGAYVLRVAALAARREEGLAILHSHPSGLGWQGMSRLDHEAERSYAHLVRQVTGLPLVGMTLAGDGSWSAREWEDADPAAVDSIRVVGPSLKITWNPRRCPAPAPTEEQVRTVSAWGPAVQADLARLRVLVIGLGSVGLDVAQRLAATGVSYLGLMDYDIVKVVNRDRMIGATRDDARRRLPKVEVAARLASSAATARRPTIMQHDLSVCSVEGLVAALDYDLIFCCVDRPWPRAVLNGIAYSDLVPVIDGGIGIDVFGDGRMRGATIRVQTATPGLPCLTCAGQLRMERVTLDMEGLLEDPKYLAAAGLEPMASQNVAALSAGVSARQLEQFVSLLATPADRAAPGPLRFLLAPHILEHVDVASLPGCQFERRPGEGDARIRFTRESGPWVEALSGRLGASRGIPRWLNRLRNSLFRGSRPASNMIVVAPK